MATPPEQGEVSGAGEKGTDDRFAAREGGEGMVMELSIGDEVTWTHAWQRGMCGIDYTTRTAKIISLTERGVSVKFRGKIITLRRDRVRKKGQTTELTEMVMGMGTP